MDLNKLYDIAERENIKIDDWHIEDAEGIYLNYDKINAIILNYDKFGTYIDEKCTLAHELGHYFTNSTYPITCQNQILIDKAEYRSNKWCILSLIPYEDLKLAIKKRF